MYKYLLHICVFICEWFRSCFKTLTNRLSSQWKKNQGYELYSSDDEDIDFDTNRYLRTCGEFPKASNGCEKGEGKSDQCYICLEPVLYLPGTNILSCTHNNRFHMACLWKWVVENSVTDFPQYGIFNVSCPLCRNTKVVQIGNVSWMHRRR
jgi:hypothetical protein